MKKSCPLFVSWGFYGLLLGITPIASKASSLYGFAYHLDLHARDSSTDQLSKEYNEKMEKQKKEKEEREEKERKEKEERDAKNKKK